MIRMLKMALITVSQFTLLASTKKGSKPDFHGAMGGDEAKRLYQYFYRRVQEGYAADKVKDGVFQAMMQVALVNDGPVSPSQKAPPLSFFLWVFCLYQTRSLLRSQQALPRNKARRSQRPRNRPNKD